MSQFGKFHDFCRDSTLPVCNLFQNANHTVEKSCTLVGFTAAGGHEVRNLGVVLLAGMAIFAAVGLIILSERKLAAVGRREIQIFLAGYLLISLAEIFSQGGFLTNLTVIKWFSVIHIGAITATVWVMLLNAIVGYQMLDDGTLLSVGLIGASALALFIGTGYIAADTAFNVTGKFEPDANDTNYALYVLYLLFPIIMLAAYFVLEAVLVLHVLGERRPMLLLSGSALLFAIGQIFQFVISVHLCTATKGKIDGSLFETLFTLLAVVALWFFWSSITEDDWSDEPLNPTMSENNYP